MAYKDKEKNKRYMKKYRSKPEVRERRRELAKINAEHLKKQRKTYKKKNKKKIQKQTKTYYKKTKKKANAKTSKWSKNNKSRVQFNAARSRSKKYEEAFDLVFTELDWPDVCPVLGIPMDRRDKNHTPSLDRVDSRKGYTKANVKVISFRANRIKFNATIDELERILDYMKKNTS